MPERIFGNPQALEDSTELKAKIDKIQQTDPTGWTEAYLTLAKGAVVNAISEQRMKGAKYKDHEEALKADLELEKQIEKEMGAENENIDTLSKLQSFIEASGITPPEDGDLELSAYEYYLDIHEHKE